MRLTSEFWISALFRKEQSDGSFVSVARKGAESAGAIFIIQSRFTDEKQRMFGPAPQAMDESLDSDDRTFELIMEWSDRPEIQQKIQSEVKFDPDLWVIEIEKNGELLLS